MKNKGITLVALVITIIILLILAGISISALTNQGLFKQAQNAKNLTEEKTAEENEILTNYLEQMNAILGGQVTESIPDGATVTPINDITTWLKTGGISKQYSYTTIEQVMADSTCIETLMNNENAMKYLARSTEFANAICVSETAMTYLGDSAYVDDTVLNSDSWIIAINKSNYYELIYRQVINYNFIYDGSLNGGSSNLVGGSVQKGQTFGSITYNSDSVYTQYTMSGGGAICQVFIPTTSLSNFAMYAMKLKCEASDGNSNCVIGQTKKYGVNYPREYSINLKSWTQDSNPNSPVWKIGNITDADSYPYVFCDNVPIYQNKTAYIWTYEVVMFAQDEYEELAAIIGHDGATETELISNYYSEICSSKKAIKYMFERCTGTFMIQALTDSTFLNALKNSSYYDLVKSNVHWGRFLSIL